MAAATLCLRNAHILPAASFIVRRKPSISHVPSGASHITTVFIVLPPYHLLTQNLTRLVRPSLSSPSSRNDSPLCSKVWQIKCSFYHPRNSTTLFHTKFLALPLAMLQSSLLAFTWVSRIWAYGGTDGVAKPLRQGGLGMALLSTSAIAKDHISPVLLTLRSNPTFMSGLLAWAIAQLMKIFTTYFVERRWDLKMLMGSGGMPSSHSALCVGLTTAVALCHGVADSLFPVCLGFSLIVMYDATGVRRHAGMQAEVLNMIVKDLFQGHPVSQKKLKELLGHTPLQVIAGACLGMLVGYWCSTVSSRSLL